MKTIKENGVEVVGTNVTEADLEIAKQYDLYVNAIEDYSQLKKARVENDYILEKLKNRGVSKVRFTYIPIFQDTYQIKEFDLDNGDVTISPLED